jgi:hypothetical protein
MRKKKGSKAPEKPFRWTLYNVFSTFEGTMGLIGKARPSLWTKWQRLAKDMLMAVAKENGLETTDEVANLPETTPLGEEAIRLREKLEEWCQGLMVDGVDVYQYEDAERREIQSPTMLREAIDEIIYMQHLRCRTPELLAEFRARREVLTRILDEEYSHSSPETVTLSERAAAALRDFRDWFSRGPGGGKK